MSHRLFFREMNESMAERTSIHQSIGRFVGRTDSEVDEKSRITIPSKFRESLGKNFVVFLSKHNSLHLIPKLIHDRICEELESYDPLEDAVDFYKRIFFESSEDRQDYDQQGRFVIPYSFRETAKLTPRVKIQIFGAGNWVEVWNSDEYESYKKNPMGYQLERVQMINEAYSKVKKLRTASFQIPNTGIGVLEKGER